MQATTFNNVDVAKHKYYSNIINMRTTKYIQFHEKALDEMFVAVGLPKWDKEFTKQDGWYAKKTWTEKRESDYKKWFLKEIKKDLKVNKVTAEREWNWFSLMWGWKTV